MVSPSLVNPLVGLAGDFFSHVHPSARKGAKFLSSANMYVRFCFQFSNEFIVSVLVRDHCFGALLCVAIIYDCSAFTLLYLTRIRMFISHRPQYMWVSFHESYLSQFMKSHRCHHASVDTEHSLVLLCIVVHSLTMHKHIQSTTIDEHKRRQTL